MAGAACSAGSRRRQRSPSKLHRNKLSNADKCDRITRIPGIRTRRRGGTCVPEVRRRQRRASTRGYITARYSRIDMASGRIGADFSDGVLNRSRPGEENQMNAPAAKFMIESTWSGRLFGGEWSSAAGGSLDVLEPATGKRLTQVGNATAADVRKPAAKARAAQPGWAATPYEKRAAILRKAARHLEENQDELITWIARETGGIPAKAGFEIHLVTEILYRSSAMCTEPQGLVLPSDPGRISLARRVPRGVIGVISPFNFPLILSCRAVAPALATGNAVVLTPGPRTPLTGGFAIARIFEEAGLPKGVLQVLPGGAEAGEALCSDPDIAMVSFTGSSNVGRRLGELAGKHLKKVQLELGGKK